MDEGLESLNKNVHLIKTDMCILYNFHRCYNEIVIKQQTNCFSKNKKFMSTFEREV